MPKDGDDFIEFSDAIEHKTIQEVDAVERPWLAADNFVSRDVEDRP